MIVSCVSMLGMGAFLKSCGGPWILSYATGVVWSVEEEEVGAIETQLMHFCNRYYANNLQTSNILYRGKHTSSDL